MFTRQGFKKYFANTSWLMAEKFVAMGLTFLVGIFVARYLGPEQFGIRSYAQSFVLLFLVFAVLGLDQIVVRELVKNENRQDVILGTAFFLKLVGSLLMIAILAVLLPFIEKDRANILFILIIAFSSIFKAFNVLDFYFQSRVQAKFSVYSNLLKNIGSSLFKLYLIYCKASLFWFILAFVLEEFLFSAGLCWAYVRQKLGFASWRFDKNIARELLKSSWPLIFSGIMITIYMRIDQVMIKFMMDEHAVGIYAAALRISEIFYFIPMVITTSLFPSIINAKQKDESLYLKRIQALYDLLMVLGLGISVVFTVFSNFIIVSLFGPEYFAAAEVLRINVWAVVFVFLGVATSQYLITEDFTKITFARTFFGAVANVILNLYLIPQHGIRGAAVATVISQFISLFSIAFFPGTVKNISLILKSFYLPGCFMRMVRFGVK